MSTRYILPLIALLQLSYACPISAATWHVGRVGSQQAPAIQASIDLAAEGDTILVGQGTFEVNLRLLGKALVLLSRNQATLKPSRLDQPIVSFVSAESPSTIVEGFRITGASAAPAVSIAGASPTLTNNEFIENHSIAIESLDGSPYIVNNRFIRNDSSGEARHVSGTIFISKTDHYNAFIPAPTIEDNLFLQNIARFGGAVSMLYGSTIFRGNEVIENECLYDGGGLFIWPHLTHVIVENNTFSSNEAGDHGGAVAAENVYSGQIDIRYNVMVRNRARGEGARGVNGVGGAIHISGLRGSVAHNTIAYNIAGPTYFTGGGIALAGTSSREFSWAVERNIVAFNHGGGVYCLDESHAGSSSNNLQFGNSLLPDCGSMTVVEDPLFCQPDGGDFSVAEGSPALTHDSGPFGALEGVGCTNVPVRTLTWGQLKARFN